MRKNTVAIALALAFSGCFAPVVSADEPPIVYHRTSIRHVYHVCSYEFHPLYGAYGPYGGSVIGAPIPSAAGAVDSRLGCLREGPARSSAGFSEQSFWRARIVQRHANNIARQRALDPRADSEAAIALNTCC